MEFSMDMKIFTYIHEWVHASMACNFIWKIAHGMSILLYLLAEIQSINCYIRSFTKDDNREEDREFK